MVIRIEAFRNPGSGGWEAGPQGRGGDAALRRFYAGEPLQCPVGCGGTAEVVRIGTLGDGWGELWAECTSCAQRERYRVPMATEGERAAVAAAVALGQEASCDRHARRVGLQRRGRQLVCPECGVRYRE